MPTFRHLFLSGPTYTRGFTSPGRRGPAFQVPDRDRFSHGTYVRQRLEAAWAEEDQRRAVSYTERRGTYLDFFSEPGFNLMVQSLETVQSGIRLLGVREVDIGGEPQTIATVYVPHEKRRIFLNKIDAYVTKDSVSGKPRNANLINSIADIRASVLDSFWQDDVELIPGDTPTWIEVWLNCNSENTIEQFGPILTQLQIERAEGLIKFPERIVLLILANNEQLSNLIEVSDDIAEFRRVKEVASFFIDLENRDQLEFVRDLLDRTSFDDESGVAVCILDTGVNNGHPLIRPVLADEDLHTYLPEWGVEDHDGHGTLMAGTVAYGDLLAILDGTGTFRVDHQLESAKIMPPLRFGPNHKKLWGYITIQGISRAEIQAPRRKRIVCMAITSVDEGDRGRPSSWSSTIDELASGYDDDTQRLIMLSGGNIRDLDEWRNYPTSNLTNEIRDPAQAWNALTVGAFTEKVHITDHNLRGFSSVAPTGGLSPFSTTSTTWPRKWPVKPDVVFEGGNVARDPSGEPVEVNDLKLISTSNDPSVTQFSPFGATSAASAQAAWMGAKIWVQYPDAWPETVRALIVHSAQWNQGLTSQFLTGHPTKKDYARLLKICGYGVPDMQRALYCTNNSVTLISQATLQPFDRREDGAYVTRDMHLYDLPWPSLVLTQLGELQVQLRVTLSYFIEPSPGEVGWEYRYRYASHGLRFDINGPSEDEDEFVRRINRQAREDGEHPGTIGAADKWVIGEARNVGSIHSDTWIGSAVELASSNKIAVYPTIGWWRERHHLNRWNKHCRYALIVSINTPAQHIDIYTPVAVQIGVAIPVEITATGVGA